MTPRQSARLVAASAIAVCTALSLHAQTTIYSNTADNSVYANGPGNSPSTVQLEGVVTKDTLWLGRISSTLGGAPVFVFQLPTLAAGDSFTSANFTVTTAISMTGNLAQAGDLYGLGARSTPTVNTTDWFAGISGERVDATDATPLKYALNNDGSAGPGAFIPNNVTYLAGDQFSFTGVALTDYLNAQYANGAGAGKYIFLRINMANFATANRIELASGDHANADWRPSLTFTTAIPEPSSFAALAGLAGLGFAASRRRARG
jgi:hypothetical protein